ncbi:hypothetical protein CRENBAI_023443 [Crenichthys baileyi]|uniref:Uncharacterized protein n=1 Tax=Crenichthys baileyi TaxID=28760 RepID=A0AAV9QPV1_9TELE
MQVYKPALEGLNALPFDPAANNDPLQFNGSSGQLGTECAPLDNTAENGKKRKRASLPPGVVQLLQENCSFEIV